MDIIVATPLRLLALIHSGDVDLSTIEIVVLDEADKLFELEAPGKNLSYTVIVVRLWCNIHVNAVSSSFDAWARMKLKVNVNSSELCHVIRWN